MHTKHNSSKHCSYLPLRFTLFVLRIFAFHGICIGCACFEFLLSLFCSLLSYKHKHTHTHAHPHYICSCSHALSACHLVRSVAGPGTRPCPSRTHSLTHKHTHTQARLRVNKRLSVSLRFEKSNSDLFCQAHSSPYPPPTPYRTQLTAYSTMENNKKRKNNKKVLCCCFQLQLVPYFWHSRLLKMELLFVVYRRIVAITWLGTICLHVECFYVWSTRFYRYVTSTSYQLPPTYLPTCPCLLQLILTLNSDSTLSHTLQLRTPNSIGTL